MTTMRMLFGAGLLAGVAVTPIQAQTASKPLGLTAPVRMQAAGKVIQVEAPGYAAPCWADVDGDRRKDLVVGQFAQGRMKVYRNLGKGKLAEGRWLEAGGTVAEVPGVW
jgi:hypothetical protein